ncbi:uncharacterized protein LOC117111540 [Anneissia japonica]|uniref:uncharacterized protein LOC117111540 n=1 Tax=Anneissia japonica TaxID=1529436 RepID=UPI0014259D1B|nr:uncharacterized protein LOC117111540 [Anneissia japonica]XP_033110363.1 uncharacterized protein LOC117111540 [Anneissia japonica]
MLKLIIRVCILLLSVAMPTFSSYCSEYPVSGSSLQFTDPDPTNLRIDDVGTATFLACCAGNYDSITWYFKDKLYPNWNISKPQLRNYISFKERGQVLQFYEVTYEMEGYYRCVISNSKGESLTFKQRLLVKPPQTGTMFPVQQPDCVNKSARIGENITFYCEYFIGESEICPSVVWQRNETSQLYVFGYEFYLGSYSNFTSFVVEDSVCSKDKSTITTALHIYNVSDDAYGPFTLYIVRGTTVGITLELSKINDPPPDAQPNIIEQAGTQSAIVFSALSVVIIVLTLLVIYFKTDLLLIYKHYLEKEASEGKEILLKILKQEQCLLTSYMYKKSCLKNINITVLAFLLLIGTEYDLFEL